MSVIFSKPSKDCDRGTILPILFNIVEDMLPILFRCNISPSGRNNDEILGGLVTLLDHSYDVFHNGEQEARPEEIDVMDFIYEELFYVVMESMCPPYAPYIMKLICDMVTDQDDRFVFAIMHNYDTLREVTPYGPPLSPRRWSSRLWSSTGR
jgi:hypothetical protein